MDGLEGVFFSGTHGGETLSLAAAAATLDVIANEPVTETLWRNGAALKAGINDAIERHDLTEWVTCSGPSPMTFIKVREPQAGADLPAKTLLQQELLRRGVLFNGSHLLSYAHGEREIAYALSAYDEALEVLARALPDRLGEYLETAPLGPVFRAH
jgi:glutamate-1-semialdehyde aminotransferase